jgi:hypothetical protein
MAILDPRTGQTVTLPVPKKPAQSGKPAVPAGSGQKRKENARRRRSDPAQLAHKVAASRQWFMLCALTFPARDVRKRIPGDVAERLKAAVC